MSAEGASSGRVSGRRERLLLASASHSGKIREWSLGGRQGTFVDNTGDYADSLFTIFLLATGIGVSTIFDTSNRELVP